MFINPPFTYWLFFLFRSPFPHSYNHIPVSALLPGESKLGEPPTGPHNIYSYFFAFLRGSIAGTFASFQLLSWHKDITCGAQFILSFNNYSLSAYHLEIQLWTRVRNPCPHGAHIPPTVPPFPLSPTHMPASFSSLTPTYHSCLSSNVPSSKRSYCSPSPSNPPTPPCRACPFSLHLSPDLSLPISRPPHKHKTKLTTLSVYPLPLALCLVPSEWTSIWRVSEWMNDLIAALSWMKGKEKWETHLCRWTGRDRWRENFHSTSTGDWDDHKFWRSRPLGSSQNVHGGPERAARGMHSEMQKRQSAKPNHLILLHHLPATEGSNGRHLREHLSSRFTGAKTKTQRGTLT